MTGCSSDAGTATSTQVEVTPAGPPSPVALKVAASPLAGLVVVPDGYLEGALGEPEQLSGPFARNSFVDKLSPSPAEDLALLLNASFTEGYQAFRVSPDRRQRLTVQLFKAGSNAKAQDLQQGFWNQDEHTKAFAVPGVPGATSDARVVPDGAAGRVLAVAEASFVVGAIVAEVKVTETGTVERPPVPDSPLIANLAKQQRDRLTAKSG
jgi:hypothetical protein